MSTASRTKIVAFQNGLLRLLVVSFSLAKHSLRHCLMSRLCLGHSINHSHLHCLVLAMTVSHTNLV